jgi:hypothetical protein
MIPCVDASDMPPEIIDWCESHDYSTHYHSSVVTCHDENVFTKWCESIGIKPDRKKPKYWKDEFGEYFQLTVAIIAT